MNHATNDLSEWHLTVLAADVAGRDGEKGFIDRGRELAVQATALSAETMRQNLAKACEFLELVFSATTARVGDYELSKVQVRLDVTTTGEVRLVGAVSVEASGGLTMEFTRKP